MHTIFKKLTSLVLVAFMVLSMVPIVAVTANAAEGDQTYQKITSAPTDWSGEYLIVYEAGNVAFDGSRTTLDAENNTVSVTITDGKIIGKLSEKTFTINADGNIRSKSGYYIGNNSNSNALSSSTSTVYTNTISFNADGTVKIVSKGGAYLRYNATSGQCRFRYYKSSSYASQKAITLYKLVDTSTPDPTVPTECGHTNTKNVAEVPATCTTPGTTAGIKCSDCGAVISGCDEIPVIDHIYENGECTMCHRTQPQKYKLVTDINTLAEGSQIVIVYDNMAMGAQNSNYRGTVGITIVDATFEYIDGVCVLTLGGNSTDGWTLKASEGYLYCSGSKGNLNNSVELIEGCTWKIDPDSGIQNIDNSTYYLQYNTGSPRFACYAGTLKNVSIYKLDCSHANTEEKAEEPATCTETGYTAGVYCNDCGTYISGHEIIEALGHSLDEGVITTAPTCTEDGVKTFTCTREGCDYSKTETIEATGHTMDEGVITTAPTCTEDGVKTCTCTVCGATETQPVEKLGHNWLDWKETKAPTCTETGEQTGTCSRCGETKTVKSPVTKHTYGEDGVCIDCGAIRTEATNRYYIAAQHKNDSTYYMTINLDGSSRFLAEKADLGEANELPEKITAPEANKVFVLVDNGDETYSIYAEGLTDNNYLGMPNGTGGTFVGRDEALKLSKEDNADGTCNFYFYYSDTKKYLSLNMQNDSSVFFGWYDDVPANNNKNLALIPVEGEAVTPAEKNPLVKWNITLQDNLKVNFHLDLNEGEQVYLKVGSAEVIYNLSDLTKTAEGYYVATVSMAAAQMMDEINVQVIDLANEKLLANKTYTIRGYADIILNGSYSDATKAMVNEMLNYGGMAQKFFNYNTGNPANAGITGVGATPVPESAGSDMNKTNDSDGCITFYGASLVYRDKIAVRYYFDVTNAEGLKFTADGNECEAVQTGGHYMIEVPDICPQDYDTQITVTVTNAEGHSATVSYGPMNYIVRMYKKAADAGRQDIMDLLQALYNYHLAAVAYIAAQNP